MPAIPSLLIDMKNYSEEQLIEIFERLISMGYGEKSETKLIKDLTLEQLEQLSLNNVN